VTCGGATPLCAHDPVTLNNSCVPAQLPCVQLVGGVRADATGNTQCVTCTENTSGLCSPTEAVVVARDMERGRVWANAPTADSCYQCLTVRTCLDSDAGHSGVPTTSGIECQDLPAGFIKGSTTYTSAQACLDVLNCTLGTAQLGTPGALGTLNPAPAPGCVAPPFAGGDGVINCFCGPAEPDLADCEAADRVGAGTTGLGPGVDSPNGACASVIAQATGEPPTATNGKILLDYANNNNTGAGLARFILDCGGADATLPGFACPPCFN
jgi:hypothetical protein